MNIRASHLRRTAPLLAQLALFAMLFQIAAIDHHWHPDVNSVQGVEGSSAHQMHCHGGSGGCANGSGSLSSAIVVTAAPVPGPSETFAFTFDLEHESADGATIAPDINPPRAASST